MHLHANGSSYQAAISAAWESNKHRLLFGHIIWESEDLKAAFDGILNDEWPETREGIDIIRAIGDGRVDHPGCPVYYHHDLLGSVPAIVLKVSKKNPSYIKIHGNFPDCNRAIWTKENRLSHQFSDYGL